MGIVSTPDHENTFEINLHSPFSLEQTLCSEQCPADLWFFDDSVGRWVTYMPIENQWTKLMLKQERNDVIVVTYEPAESDVESIKEALFYHLSLDYDLSSLISSFQNDRYMSKVFEHVGSLRVMRDLNKEYRILGAIITQNTSVRMIKTAQRLMFLHYGDEVHIGQEVFHSYPKVERIAEETTDALRSKCKVGYRAEYLRNISQALLSENIVGYLESLDTDEAKNYLMSFKGIGSKVSDLILMYGLGRRDVFPLDVWVKRAIKREYFGNDDASDKDVYRFAREYFGNFASIVNLMIFAFERKNKGQFFNYCIWR
jgi:N-glycosylase/DNA lyase